MTNLEKLRETFPKTIFIFRKNGNDETAAIMCSDEWLNSEYEEPAAEMLEQEPKTDTLDKIRAEIPKLSCGDNEYRQALVKVADVIKCIDRHNFDGHKEEENGEED